MERKIVGKSRVNNGKIGKDMYITRGKHAFGKGKKKYEKGKGKCKISKKRERQKL